MKLSLRRATAHERQRRHLDHSPLQMRRDALGLEHVVQRVEQRPKIRIDLGHQVARQEAEALAGLDGGAGEDDPVDLAPAERGGGQRHRQECLAGAGGADAERDRVVADRVDVALLVDGLGRDLGRAVAPDHVLQDLAGRLVLVERALDRLDRARRDLVALDDQLGELVHDRGSGLDRVGLAVERQHVAAQEHVAVQMSLQRPQDRVLAAGELGRNRVLELYLPTHPPCPVLRLQSLPHACGGALAVGPTARLGHHGLHHLPHVLGVAGAGLGDGGGDDRVELGVVELGRQVALD